MKKEKILVVEDEPILRMHISRILKQNGFHSLSAENGRKALNILKNEDIDLVISDIEMPDLDGYELLSKLHQDPQTAQIPFFFLTGRGDSKARVLGLKHGVQDYITKPINTEELILRIRNTLSLVKKANCFKPGSADFAGTIKNDNLSNLIQFIQMNHWSGKIFVKWKDGEGEIWCTEGEMKTAYTSDGLAGDEAVKAVLNLSEGYFFCRDDHESPAHNIQSDTMQLLLNNAVSKDTKIHHEKSLLVIKFQSICRKMSELYTEEWMDMKERLGSLEEQISSIDFSNVSTSEDVIDLKDRLEKIEQDIAQVYFEKSHQSLALFSDDEDLRIEKRILMYYLDKTIEDDVWIHQKESLLNKIQKISLSASDGFKVINRQLFSLIRSQKSDLSNRIDLSFLPHCQASITQALKSKQEWHVVSLKEINQFFSKFSKFSSWSLRFGFIGIYSCLIPFLQQMGRVPKRFSRGVHEGQMPALLVKRIRLDKAHFIYLIGYPVMDINDTIKSVLKTGDLWNFLFSDNESERIFNRELLAELLMNFPDRRVVLVRRKDQRNIPTRNIFRLLKDWESKRTLEVDIDNHHAFQKIIRYWSKQVSLT